MSDRIVSGVFDNHACAEKAVKALKAACFKTQDISVIGTDCDKFRLITAQLQAKGPDRYATIFGVVGAFLGGITWLLVTASLPGMGTATVLGPPLALISGGIMGALLGLVAGVVIHFDTPEYAGRVYEGDLSVGEVLLAVHTKDTDDRMRAENIMERCGAIEVASAATTAILGGLKRLQPLVKTR